MIIASSESPSPATAEPSVTVPTARGGEDVDALRVFSLWGQLCALIAW